MIDFQGITFSAQHLVMLRISERSVTLNAVKTPCIELSFTGRFWYLDYASLQEAEKAKSELLAKIREDLHGRI